MAFQDPAKLADASAALTNISSQAALVLGARGAPLQTGIGQSTDDYIKTNFTTIPGTQMQVRDKGRTMSDSFTQLSKVDLSREACKLNALCNPRDVQRAKMGRLNDDGEFYPFVQKDGTFEGAGNPALLSINGAHFTVNIKGGLQLKPKVAGGNPELAQDIHDVEIATGKTVIGFRSIDVTKGMFAMIYSDKDGSIKMGQFVVKNCPQASDYTPGTTQFAYALRNRIHPEVLSVVKYYLNKP